MNMENIKEHPTFRGYGLLSDGSILNFYTMRRIKGRTSGKNKGYMRVNYEGKRKEILESKFCAECLLGHEIKGKTYADGLKEQLQWYNYQTQSLRQPSPYRIRWERKDGTTVFFANSEQLRKATGVNMYNCITKTTRKKTIKALRRTTAGLKSYTIIVERRFL